MTLYVNKSRFGGSRLREKNLVYLLRRNIKIIRPSDKLDSKKIGLFKIKRNIVVEQPAPCAKTTQKTA
jgi:hypothetical protein